MLILALPVLADPGRKEAVKMKRYILVGFIIVVLVIACQKVVVQVGDEGHETHEAGSIDFDAEREIHQNKGE